MDYNNITLPRRWHVSPPFHKDIFFFQNKWKELVNEGAIFLYPTETVYGLGCYPFKEEWVAKIYTVKNRPKTRPLLLVASDIRFARNVFRSWPRTAAIITEKFWPGAVTIVLPAADYVPEIVHAGTGKVAVRVSPHPIARSLAEAAGGLIISTSANRSGDLPIRSPDEFNPLIYRFVDVVIDAGRLENSTPSTIVDCSNNMPKLIREGSIPFSAILHSVGYS